MLSSALVCVAQTLAGTYDHIFERENEDAYLLVPEQVSTIPPKGLLVTVLDGISSGGYGAAAARAARTAIQVRWSMVADDDTASDPLELVYQLMLAAQHGVLGSVQAGLGGAACLIALIRDGLLTFGHVGDCQLFLRRAQASYKALTEDQTALLRTRRGREIKRLVEQGQHLGEPVSEQQLGAYAELENTLTRYLGKADLPPDPRQWVETGQAQLHAGDLLLLCTDGLLKALALAELDRELPIASEQLVAALISRIEQSYQHDRDDTTLCLIEVRSPLPAVEARKRYTPTFLPMLGEEADGSAVQREQYATITEELQPRPDPSPAAPPARSAALHGSKASPLAPEGPEYRDRLLGVLLIVLIGVLLIGVLWLVQP